MEQDQTANLILNAPKYAVSTFFITVRPKEAKTDATLGPPKK
jgi:hypothetical protein